MPIEARQRSVEPGIGASDHLWHATPDRAFQRFNDVQQADRFRWPGQAEAAVRSATDALVNNERQKELQDKQDQYRKTENNMSDEAKASLARDIDTLQRGLYNQVFIVHNQRSAHCNRQALFALLEFPSV